jgi:glucose/arabinose dehydrogenase
VRRTLAALIAMLAVAAAPAGARITAPAGVKVDTWVRGIPNASNVDFDSRGRMWVTSAAYVTEPASGVWMVPRRGAKPRQVVKRLFTALGLRWYRNSLYVSYLTPYGYSPNAVGRVAAYSGFDGRRFRHRRLVLDKVPVGLHSVDSIVAGPGGRLYMGIGSKGDDFAGPSRFSGSVTSFKPDGSGMRVEANGLRNPYGIAFIPHTNTLVAGDNGRDDLGLNTPPDELNAFDVTGAAPFFGFPRCWGRAGGSCGGTVAPLVELAPHAAAGGVAVSPSWGNSGLTAFVGENGSSFKNHTGSDVVSVSLSGSGKALRGTAHKFAGGFQVHDPLGTAIGPGGALFVTLHNSGSVVRFRPPRL